MLTVSELTNFLDTFAPATLAESWDNVGLLLGDPQSIVNGVMTCLTLTPDVAAEAIRQRASLIVTHHPILFRPVQRLTTETTEGAMLLSLVQAGVAVYSPHTAFDSASEGINARICDRIGLTGVQPIRPKIETTTAAESVETTVPGAGRYGRLASATSFEAFANRLREAFQLTHLDAVPMARSIQTVGVACGAAAEFLPDAAHAGCDLLVTGEARFHAALEARSLGIGLVLLGHYASERFAVEELADVIAARFPELTAWPSRDESDPLVRCG